MVCASCYVKENVKFGAMSVQSDTLLFILLILPPIWERGLWKFSPAKEVKNEMNFYFLILVIVRLQSNDSGTCI